jgi:hypothetical protein
MPVVTLTGPRQSGKTTLARGTFPDFDYASLERPDLRERAIADPLGFLAGLGDRVILDEVQRHPDLLSYIQDEVDSGTRPRRFVLTGSHDLLLMDSVARTLAGRTANLHLYPLSVAELSERPAIDPFALHSIAPGRPPPRSRWETVWAGFYPRIHDQGLEPRSWLADYYRTYVERDLREVQRVVDLDAFQTFVRLAAARTACEINYSELAQDAGISQPTAKQWLSVLRTGFLCTVLPPHHRNFRKRLRKRSRLHFLDSGLVCYLLGITSPDVLASHPLRGAIFESFVVGELVKTFAHAGEDPPLYHWRDATGREIDVLVDLGTELIPIEVKSGATVASDAVDTLAWWTNLPGNPQRRGILVHGGDETLAVAGFRVLPWFLQ